MQRAGLGGLNGKDGDPPPERQVSSFRHPRHFASPAWDRENQQWGGKRA